MVAVTQMSVDEKASTPASKPHAQYTRSHQRQERNKDVQPQNHKVCYLVIQQSEMMINRLPLQQKNMIQISMYI